MERTPSSSQNGEGYPPQQLFNQSMMGTPSTTRQRQLQGTPSSNNSSQSSAQALSVISISTAFSYQRSSGPGGADGFSSNHQGAIASVQQQSRSNSLMTTPNPPQLGGGGGRGTPMKCVFLQQPDKQEVPSESGQSGVGRGGRKAATPARGSGRGGARKTSYTPAGKVEEENGKQADDEVQIVLNKGVNSGRSGRGGARSQRIEALLSSGAETETECQRLIRTRDNERKRRAAYKESADRLRDLVPELKEGQTRKVGEGVVMQKTAEYIEQLEAELEAERQKDKLIQDELTETLVSNLLKHKKCHEILLTMQKHAHEGKDLPDPPANEFILKMKPKLTHSDPDVNKEMQDIIKIVRQKAQNRKSNGDDVATTSSADKCPALSAPRQGTSGGAQTQQHSSTGGPGREIVKIQRASAALPPITGIPQGQHQGPSQVRVRPVAPQQAGPQQQQLVLSSVASTSRSGGVRALLSPAQQGDGRQLVRTRSVVNSQALASLQAQVQPLGSIGGQQLVGVYSPHWQGRKLFVKLESGDLQLVEPRVPKNPTTQPTEHGVIGGGGVGEAQNNGSKSMTLPSLKGVEEQQPTHSVEGKMDGGAVNLVEIKKEPMEMDDNGVGVTGLRAVKKEVDCDKDSSGQGGLVAVINEVNGNNGQIVGFNSKQNDLASGKIAEENNCRVNLEDIKKEVDEEEETGRKELEEGADLNAECVRQSRDWTDYPD